VAKERAAAEGNARAEDVVVVYRNKGSEGNEGERKLQYFVVDGIEALNKFGADPWFVSFCSFCAKVGSDGLEYYFFRAGNEWSA